MSNPHCPGYLIYPKPLSVYPPQLKTQDIFQFFVFHRVLVFGDSIARRTHGNSGPWNYFGHFEIDLALLHFKLGFEHRFFELELICEPGPLHHLLQGSGIVRSPLFYKLSFGQISQGHTRFFHEQPCNQRIQGLFFAREIENGGVLVLNYRTDLNGDNCGFTRSQTSPWISHRQEKDKNKPISDTTFARLHHGEAKVHQRTKICRTIHTKTPATRIKNPTAW